MTKEKRPKKKTRTAKGQLRDGHHLGDVRDKGGREQKTNKPERQGRSQKTGSPREGARTTKKKDLRRGGP